MFIIDILKVALLQVSIPSCSYLVDVVKLEDEVSEEEWIEFFKALFCTESSIKLGSCGVFLQHLLFIFCSFN